MDVRDAVRAAKHYVTTVFAEESPSDIGLEEVERKGSTWAVTIGFSRAWDEVGPISAMNGTLRRRRTYKQVKVRDADGEVISVKHRDVGD